MIYETNAFERYLKGKDIEKGVWKYSASALSMIPLSIVLAVFDSWLFAVALILCIVILVLGASKQVKANELISSAHKTFGKDEEEYW